MWIVENLSEELSEDFYVKEDVEFVYLYYKEEEIAKFSNIGVDPEEIKKVAEEYDKGT